MSTTGIYQRPDSPYWWANWTNESGKAIRQSTRVIVSEDPHGLRAMAVRERFMQPANAPHELVGNTWDELIELYLEHLAATCRASTLQRYEAALRQLYPAFTGNALDSITRHTVKAYLRNRQVTCQAATINVVALRA